jgi:hypothetical protein
VCHVTDTIFAGAALSTESESRCYIDTLNANIHNHCRLREDSVRTLQRTPALAPSQLPVQYVLGSFCRGNEAGSWPSPPIVSSAEVKV